MRLNVAPARLPDERALRSVARSPVASGLIAVLPPYKNALRLQKFQKYIIFSPPSKILLLLLSRSSTFQFVP